MILTSKRLKILNGYTKLNIYWYIWECYMDDKRCDHLSIKDKKKLICREYLNLIFKGKYNRDDKL